MILRPLTVAVYLFLLACTRIQYKDGASTFTRTSFGTNLEIMRLTASIDPNGSRSITLQGYRSDQAEAYGAVAEGVATGLAKAARP